MPSTQRMKLVTVGDGGVGKSSMFISYVTGSFPSMYVPTVFDNYVADATFDAVNVEIALWDTAGQEDYDRLRPLSYPQTDVFFICFSVESECSLENLEHKWIPEIRHHCPDVPAIIVACKIDLRTSSSKNMVTYEQGYKIAKKYDMKYCETSSLTQAGLKSCFDEAIRSGLNASEAKKKKKGIFGGKQKKRIPDPPVMPPTGFAPWIEIETSVFGEDWHKMLQDPKHADVTFVLEGKHRLEAHSILLSSASKVFAKVLGLTKPSANNQLKQINAIESYTREQINTGAVSGFAAIYDEEPEVKGQDHLGNVHTIIEMSADISAKTFIHVLEFLYSGVPHFSEDSDDVSEEEIRDLDRVAAILKLSQLQTICSNMLTDQDFLNPSIGTYLNDETGAKMKELFFNQEEKADVVFLVEGEQVYAHKCVLATRCQVMAAMFGGRFMESKTSNITQITIPNTTEEAFLALLEYLYTDHSPIEETDPVGIMVLSDEYGQKRLTNLCELYITKEIDRSVAKQIEKAEIDVIGLLLNAQTHNADQLGKWCLFFIASNYIAFENRKEFKMIKGENKDYVEENRWPPLAYLKEVDEYQKKYGEKQGDKCAVM